MDSKMDLDTEIFKDGFVELTIMECSICYVNKVELSFLCKHSLCKSCYLNIELCPFCRKRIKQIRGSIHEPEVMIIHENTNNFTHSNFYCAMCIISIGPLIWILFLVGLMIPSNI